MPRLIQSIPMAPPASTSVSFSETVINPLDVMGLGGHLHRSNETITCEGTQRNRNSKFKRDPRCQRRTLDTYKKTHSPPKSQASFI